ncbi:hypothetical protein INR49_014108 [Caranx melampygus]|nr:hypothetical protein INR49_014108 [Caranx melampygus]
MGAQKGPKTVLLKWTIRPKAVPSSASSALTSLRGAGNSGLLLAGPPCSMAWRKPCTLSPVFDGEAERKRSQALCSSTHSSLKSICVDRGDPH